MSRFIIKFWEDFADQPGRDVRNQKFRVRYLVFTYKFSIFFNLVQKNSLIVEKFSKCRENGNDRLRKRNARRSVGQPTWHPNKKELTLYP